jgi:Rod binding domain-containing protein
MSIFPATDIVSDVARAADPGKLRLATKRLEDLGGEKLRPDGATFAATRTSVARTDARPMTINSAAPTAPRMEALGPAQKFEAFLLQSWLEALLPKEGSGVYGNGPGADIWRSMMAEQLSTQIVRAGGVGLHQLLAHKNSSISA